MANVNTTSGWYNLPLQSNTVANAATEFTFAVPASGSYSGLPSTWLPAGGALIVSALPGDIDMTGSTATLRKPGSLTGLDCHLFKVRACARYYGGSTSSALTIKIYEVPYSIVAAQGTAAATLASSVAIGSSGALTVTSSAWAAGYLEVTCLWDSISQKLSGLSTAMVSGAVISGGAQTVQTQRTSIAEQDLNFLVTFTFTGSAGDDQVSLTEFAIDRG